MIIVPFPAGYIEDQTTAFWVTILILIFFGLSTGIAQSAIFGRAGLLPSRYMGAIIVGNGVCGVGLNLIRWITLESMPDELVLSTLIYYGISTLVMFVAIAFYFYEQNEPLIIKLVPTYEEPKSTLEMFELAKVAFGQAAQLLIA